MKIFSDLRITRALADFLERVPERCPHALFRARARASQTHVPAFVAENKRVAVRKENTATKIAALILPIVGSNYDRHARLQKFMLANDSVTVAVEIPIWLISPRSSDGGASRSVHARGTSPA